MSLTPEFRAEIERDQSERLGPDDAATRHEGEFLSIALLQQRLRAGATAAAEPGVCTNCGEHCLPLAVYCDEDCRADHEQRLVANTREGRGRR
jgi:hypothetical protein